MVSFHGIKKKKSLKFFEEVLQVIQNLKNGNAIGPDEPRRENLKCCLRIRSH